MDVWQALILGALQGLTEFIPVSSSGHLVLAEYFLGLEVETLKAFDVVVHVGTLVAIFGYFWRDFWEFILAVIHFAKRTPDGELAPEVKQHQLWLGYILLGSVPAGVIGIFFEDWIDEVFRGPVSVAVFMILIGILFILAEKRLVEFGKDESGKLTLRRSFLVGCAQAVALIPGISRSGSTISMAIAQGISREKAARFSFLLGAPAIFGAGLITGLKLMKNGNESLEIGILLAGFVSSAVVGYLCVAFLMNYLKRHTLRVFAWYLMVVGLLVLLSQMWD